MFPQLLQYQDVGWLILRLAIAVIFIYHALPKLTKPATMVSGLNMPSGAIMLVGLWEVTGSIGLIIGNFMQLGAIMLSLVMLGAIYYKIFKWHVSFFAMDKTGWEFDFILLAANIAILLGGGGNIKIF